VGAVGFGPAWTMEDSMAASIIRLEQEAEELRAEVALLREEQVILRGDGLRVAVKATSWARVARERDEWRQCAEKLHAAVCYLEPALLYDDPEGGFTNEREAVREFNRLQKEFAGVIEGGTNAAVPSPFGEHGRPSDLSLRTTLEAKP
jgi:hypothetical protein